MAWPRYQTILAAKVVREAVVEFAEFDACRHRAMAALAMCGCVHPAGCSSQRFSIFEVLDLGVASIFWKGFRLYVGGCIPLVEVLTFHWDGVE